MFNAKDIEHHTVIENYISKISFNNCIKTLTNNVNISMHEDNIFFLSVCFIKNIFNIFLLVLHIYLKTLHT